MGDAEPYADVSALRLFERLCVEGETRSNQARLFEAGNEQAPKQNWSIVYITACGVDATMCFSNDLTTPTSPD